MESRQTRPSQTAARVGICTGVTRENRPPERNSRQKEREKETETETETERERENTCTNSKDETTDEQLTNKQRQANNEQQIPYGDSYSYS